MTDHKRELADRIVKHCGTLDVFASSFLFEEPCLKYCLRQKGFKELENRDYVSRQFNLVLPHNFRVERMDPRDVGTEHAFSFMSYNRLIEIALLNSQCCPSGEDRYMFGLLRACIVRAGWLTRENRPREISFTTELPTMDDIEDFSNYILSQPRRYKLKELEKAAFLIPLMVEFTFRTRGYRYNRSSPSALRLYEELSFSLNCQDVAFLLPPKIQWGLVAHFVPLERAYEVAQSNNPLVPTGIRKRLSFHPFGTGLLRKTEELMRHVRSCWYYDELADRLDERLAFVEEVNDDIMKDPLAFHPCREAYSLGPMSPRNLRKIEDALKDCKYIVGFLKDLLKDVYDQVPWRQLKYEDY